MIEDPGQQLYPGLYGEVVTEDCYGIKAYAAEHEPPDVIFDIGANVGIFTRFAREVFPDAFIVAVEPNGRNVERFHEFTPDQSQIGLVMAAVGSGEVWRAANAGNGAHECYLTPGPGHTESQLDAAVLLERGPPPALSLAFIAGPYVEKGQSYLIKIDCEGNENAIFADAKSMEALAGADYFAIEIHTSAAHGGAPLKAVKELLKHTYERLEKTHDMVVEHTIWKGVRRAGELR
jgi:FkbM family methyltransferase